MPEPVAKRFGYILKRAQNALRTRMDEELRVHGLTTPQYAVMSAVALEPGIANADLAKAAFVTAQTMQGIIATLEKRKLLERTPDPEHGRRLMAHLTRAGRKSLKAADAGVKRVESSMMTSMSERDAKRVTDILLTCVENLTKK